MGSWRGCQNASKAGDHNKLAGGLVPTCMACRIKLRNIRGLRELSVNLN